MFSYNPYYTPRFQQDNMQYTQQSYPQNYQQSYPQNPQTYQQTLQGKSVESFDVARAIDIPIDGSISYFPLTDGSAIITKQLQMDGKSKTVIYKPDTSTSAVNDDRTSFSLEESNYIKEELKSIKTQIRELGEVIKKGVDINESNADNTTLNE